MTAAKTREQQDLKTTREDRDLKSATQDIAKLGDSDDLGEGPTEQGVDLDPKRRID
jgi:hypothetical protein